LRPTGTENLHVRRDAAMREVRAQLDTVSPTLGGRERSVQRLDGRLDENGYCLLPAFTNGRTGIPAAWLLTVNDPSDVASSSPSKRRAMSACAARAFASS